MGSTAQQCGFCIDSVNVIEIVPCEKFKKQIDDEQKVYAEISSKYLSESNKRELLELENEYRRNEIQEKANLERKQIQMNSWIEEESHQLKQVALERRIEFARQEQEAEQVMKRQKDATTIEFLKSLKELDVDITMFLCTAGDSKMIETLHSSPSYVNLMNRARQISHSSKKSKKNLQC